MDVEQRLELVRRFMGWSEEETRAAWLLHKGCPLWNFFTEIQVAAAFQLWVVLFVLDIFVRALQEPMLLQAAIAQPKIGGDPGETWNYGVLECG